MKSRMSSSKWAVFRKDITRFAPLWSLYFIGGILIMLSWTADSPPGRIADSLSDTIGPFSVINLIYAALSAQLLFGDLFNARMCNALHAMPLRREEWYISHVAAGLCFSVVPNTVGILLVMPALREFWFTGLLWLLGMTLHYIFFFGLAVLSCMCTGNRFAMAAVYVIANSISPLVQWLIRTIYEPLLRGVTLDTGLFYWLCPIGCLSGSHDYFTIEIEIRKDYQWQYIGMGGDWGYLAVTAVVGLGMLVLALVLYRRRALESAGDFMAVRPLIPVFSLLYTLCVGALFAMTGEMMLDSYVVFFLVGLGIGFFTGQMLVERTVKVFRKWVFLRMAVLAAVMLVSLAVTRLDPAGITRWMPDAGQVAGVEVASNANGYFYQGDSVFIQDPEQIQKIVEIHGQILEAGEPGQEQNSIEISLRYRLKDGREVVRGYRTPENGPYYKPLKELFSTPQSILGYTDWEDYLDRVEEIYTDSCELKPDMYRQLLEAIRADCEAGVMVQDWQFRREDDYHTQMDWIEIKYRDEAGNVCFRDLRVYANCANTLRWLEAHMDSQTDKIAEAG